MLIESICKYAFKGNATTCDNVEGVKLFKTRISYMLKL